MGSFLSGNPRIEGDQGRRTAQGMCRAPRRPLRPGGNAERDGPARRNRGVLPHRGVLRRSSSVLARGEGLVPSGAARIGGGTALADVRAGQPARPRRARSPEPGRQAAMILFPFLLLLPAVPGRPMTYRVPPKPHPVQGDASVKFVNLSPDSPTVTVLV